MSLMLAHTHSNNSMIILKFLKDNIDNKTSESKFYLDTRFNF